ncbi:MAG: molybdate ABC transporter permease subunit, partial [Oscillospiraceae bacterium]|nr:molybdate ABC transporter permease subunit [Oscillospiraceae bacterium]
MKEILSIAADFDWSPFWISLKTGVVATVICFFLGIYVARQVIKLPHRTRAVVDSILTLARIL